MQKPELLLPAGSVEAFYAALDGGADAIYLGLQDFNARTRAANFSIQQVHQLTYLAHKNDTRLYITLNTVIKNNELPDLYQLLAQLSKTKIDAIIIQDWGIYYLAKKYFKNLVIHASTQMAFHNSLGANFAEKVGIERVILARELTFKELTNIKSNSKVELELFVHGALCYSFSGMCLFSSYLGGKSANRGACKQPCRRMFSDNNKKHYIFSLKDNELIEFIPELAKMGIRSFKVEGRMKSADYVNTIAKAYRMVLDNPQTIKEAKTLLSHDVGRDKTQYFMGGNVSEAITNKPNTGIFVGEVTEVKKVTFTFTSEIAPEEIERVRVVSKNSTWQESLKIKEFSYSKGQITTSTKGLDIKVGYRVFIVGFKGKKFPQKLSDDYNKSLHAPSIKEAKNKTSQLLKPSKKGKPSLFLRIDSLAWMRKIHFDNFDFLLLNLAQKEWGELRLSSPFIAKNKHKIIAELPKFISEDNITRYRQLVQNLNKQGIKSFMINHISQLDLMPQNVNIYASEYVYTFNDAAVAQLKSFGIRSHVYPLETDFENLFTGTDRSGIVALHFTPQLFYSRMPVIVDNQEGEFKDDTHVDYVVKKKNGMTHTLPQKPVSIFQNKPEIAKKGFHRYLIDLSFMHPTQNTYKTLIKRYYKSEQFQPSTSFNYKKGLS
jgi:putative protease